MHLPLISSSPRLHRNLTSVLFLCSPIPASTVCLSRKLSRRSLLAVLALGSAVLNAAPLPQRADLSLPQIQTEAPAGLQLKASGEKIAEALAHYTTALQLEKSGKLREALPHYLKVLEVDPAQAELAAHTAELLYHYQSRDEAVRLLENAVSKHASEPAPRLNLIRFLTTYTSEDPFEKNRIEPLLQETLQQFPRRAEVYTFATLTYLSLDQRDKAVAVMNTALKLEGGTSAFWLEVGRAAQQVWPLAQAEVKEEHQRQVNPFFERALKLAPAGAPGTAIRLDVAQYYLLSNQLDSARSLCEKIATQTGNLQARKVLYRLYEAAGEKDKALQTLEKIVEDSPQDVEQRRLLVSAYMERDQFARAVPHLEATIQIGGGEAGDYQNLGELLLKSDLYDKAIQLSRRASTLYPDQPVFHIHAALAHRSMQRWDKAIQAFEHAAKLAEGTQTEMVNHRFYFQYGLTLERGGRADEAAKMFEKSIDLTPRDEIEDAASTMNYLGYMWLELDRHLDKAGELIRKANELQPDSAAYIDSLGWWYFKKGDYPNALKELLRALALIKNIEPEDAEILEHIGQVHLKMKNLSEAYRFFDQADDLQPKDPKLRKRIQEGLRLSSPP